MVGCIYIQEKTMDNEMKRGDIYYADLSGTTGCEQGGIRPVVIIQNDTVNAFSPTTIVAPLTSEQIINTVEELRNKGFIIEMDDFGSGYSSLNMLSQMSLDILKLDMKFIRYEMSKPMELSLLNDVINMAHRLHLKVVAEGVETAEQKDRLKSMNCDYAQGYFYAKPTPSQDFEKLLQH